MPPKASKEDRQKALEAFRHEQTLKRWQKGNTKKASKIVYISDFLDAGRLKLSQRKNAQRDGVIASGTLLLGGHRAGGVARGGRAAEAGGAQAVFVRLKKRRKARDPNSDAPFNHRKQFTALKRRIHAQRENAMREVQPMNAEGEEGNDRVAALLLRAQRLVCEMDIFYAQLSVAMTAKSYGRVGRLKWQLRNRRYQLCNLLRTGAIWKTPDTTQDEHAGSAETKHQIAPVGTASYVNNYPSTTLLGIGLHPQRDRIDKRTGRYPHLVPATAVQAFLREAADFSLKNAMDELVDLCLRTSGEDCDPLPLAAGRGSKGASSLPSLFVGHYCRNHLTDFLDDLTFTTLQSLYKEQRELKQKQPLQFKARQRYVVGLKETIKHLRAGRVKLVIVAADVEVHNNSSEPRAPTPTQDTKNIAGASRKAFQTLDEALETVFSLCEDGNAEVSCSKPPLVTCMSCQRLSYALFAKGSRVSCVGVLHSEKHLDLVKALRLLSTGLRLAYRP